VGIAEIIAFGNQKHVDDCVRILKGEVRDHLNDIYSSVWPLIEEKETRELVRAKFKRLQALLDKL
jgi:hypothetical protein